MYHFQTKIENLHNLIVFLEVRALIQEAFSGIEVQRSSRYCFKSEPFFLGRLAVITKLIFLIPLVCEALSVDIDEFPEFFCLCQARRRREVLIVCRKLCESSERFLMRTLLPHDALHDDKVTSVI